MSNEQGPLSINLDTASAKTTIPVFADGVLAQLRLVKIGQEFVKEKGWSTKWEYDLVAAAPNTDGGQIEPGQMGSKVFENIQLYDKNDLQPDPSVAPRAPKWAVEKIAKRIDALLGTGDAENTKGKPARPAFGPETVASLIGKVMVAKMKVSSYEGNIKNDISKVDFPSDVAA